MPGTVKSELFPDAVRKNTNVTSVRIQGKARFSKIFLDNGHFITETLKDHSPLPTVSGFLPGRQISAVVLAGTMQ